MSRIAVIGAGLSGLVVARELSRQHDVRVFEKSRGVGGRIATRYADEWEFDHGAQFFTARTASFRRFLAPLIERGIVHHWPARFVEIRNTEITARRQWDEEYPHYVAAPRMNALGKELAADLHIEVGTRIDQLEECRGGWRLRTADDSIDGDFDWVVVTAPAAQSAALLPADSLLRAHAATASMKACFALMLGFDAEPAIDWDAALVRDRDISWMSVNSSKPGREAGFAMVVHATNAWADQHIEDAIENVRDHMLDEVSAAAGIDARAATHIDVQRWRFANIDRQRGDAPQVEHERGLAVCGDWFLRGRVESAFTSAERVLDELAPYLDQAA